MIKMKKECIGADIHSAKALSDKIVQKALSLGADYAESTAEHAASSAFILKNGNPEASGLDQDVGICARIMVSGRHAFFSSNTLKTSGITQTIKNSIRKLECNPDKFQDKILSKEKSIIANHIIKEKKKRDAISTEEKLQMLKDVDTAVMDANTGVISRYFSMSDGIAERYFVNSEGSKIDSIVPRIGVLYFITVKGNNKTSQRVWQSGFSGGYENIISLNLPNKLQEEAKNMKATLTHGKKMPKGIFDVVVGPEVTGIMVHESGGHPYEADRILGGEAAQAGESFLTEKSRGLKIGTGIVNIADDPTLKNSYGFYKFDDEGVKARRKMLIKNGIVNEFLHNRETAAQLGIKSNGSARASAYNRQAVVRMSNTFMIPGKQKEEELIEGIKNGVFINNFMEWNIDDKRLNQRYVGGEAYLIKNGKLVAPVKNPVLEITTPALYKSVDAIANNLEFSAGTCGKAEPMQAIPVWFGGPSIRLRKIRFG